MNLFTYGSLMFDEVWQRVVRGHYRSSIETLRGYARHQVRDEDYPAVIRAPDAPAPLQGRLWRAVDAADPARLDAFEGEDYERISVTTESGVQAGLYLYRRSERILEKDWDPQHFEREGMARFLARYPGF